MSLWPRLEPLLPQVQKPARYIGCEDGARTPSHGPSVVSWLLTYPDTYEVGLPNQGLQILYEILNERSDAAAERAYAPWVDLEALLRRDDLPLFSAAAPPPPPAPKTSPVTQMLEGVLPDELTPRDALDLVYKLKEIAQRSETS